MIKIIFLLLLTGYAYADNLKTVIFDKAYSTDFTKELLLPPKTSSGGSVLFKNNINLPIWLDYNLSEYNYTVFCLKNGLDFWTINLNNGYLSCANTIDDIDYYSLVFNNGNGHIASSPIIQKNDDFAKFKIEFHYKHNNFEKLKFIIQSSTNGIDWTDNQSVFLDFTGITYKYFSMNIETIPNSMYRIKFEQIENDYSVFIFSPIKIKHYFEYGNNHLIFGQNTNCPGTLLQASDNTIDLPSINYETYWAKIEGNSIKIKLPGYYKLYSEINYYPTSDVKTNVIFKFINITNQAQPVIIENDKNYSFYYNLNNRLVINTIFHSVENSEYEFKLFTDNDIFLYAPSSADMGNCQKFILEKIQ